MRSSVSYKNGLTDLPTELNDAFEAVQEKRAELHSVVDCDPMFRDMEVTIGLLDHYTELLKNLEFEPSF